MPSAAARVGLRHNVAALVSRLRGGVNDAKTINSNAINGYDRYAFGFTVSSPTQVDSVSVAVSNQGGDLLAGAKIGIATGVTSATTNATFIASHTTTTALAKNGYRTVTLDAAVTLTPGTTYWFTLEGVSDNGFGVLFDAGSAAPTVSGVIATATGVGTNRFGTGNYASGGGTNTAYVINP